MDDKDDLKIRINFGALVRAGVGALYHAAVAGNEKWDSWTLFERREWLEHVRSLTQSMSECYKEVK